MEVSSSEYPHAFAMVSIILLSRYAGASMQKTIRALVQCRAAFMTHMNVVTSRPAAEWVVGEECVVQVRATWVARLMQFDGKILAPSPENRSSPCKCQQVLATTLEALTLARLDIVTIANLCGFHHGKKRFAIATIQTSPLHKSEHCLEDIELTSIVLHLHACLSKCSFYSGSFSGSFLQ